jgi:hypothetical protein
MGGRRTSKRHQMERSSASVGSGIFRCRSGCPRWWGWPNPKWVPIRQEVAAKSSLARFSLRYSGAPQPGAPHFGQNSISCGFDILLNMLGEVAAHEVLRSYPSSRVGNTT